MLGGYHSAGMTYVLCSNIVSPGDLRRGICILGKTRRDSPVDDRLRNRKLTLSEINPLPPRVEESEEPGKQVPTIFVQLFFSLLS